MTPTRGTIVLGAIVLAVVAQVFLRSFFVSAGVLGIGLAVIVACPAIVGGARALRTSLPLPHPRAIDIVTAVTATMGSLFLARTMGIPELVTAAIVLSAFGVAALPGGPLDALAAGGGYAGAFVGILTPDVRLGWYWVAAAGALAGLLWTLIGPSVLPGVGGRIGLVALMGSGGVYWVASLTGEESTPVLLPGMDGVAHWSVIPIGAAGAVITWLLINRLGWGLNLASGLPALAVCGVIAMSGIDPAGVLATAFFGGTFVGGTGPARLPHAGWLGAAGLLYGALMLRFTGPLQGHVGVVGVIAVLAVLAVIGVGAIASRCTSRARSGGSWA